MAITIQHKRDTAANWTSNNPTLSAGEIGVETDTGKFKFGDGSTAWSSLGYFEAAAPSGPSYTFQGSTSGYLSGGLCAFTCTNIIEKFSFSSDGNATDVGDLSAPRPKVSGQSSSDNGYTSGGVAVVNPGSGNVIDAVRIDKFPFSSDGNATDVGDLIKCMDGTTGQSSSTHGYVSGGRITCDSPGNKSNIIQKFPFTSDANATDVADLTVERRTSAGQSSSTHGYNSGGTNPDAPVPTRDQNVIDKFPFSSDSNATDVGDLTLARGEAAGQSSSTHGYSSGGPGFGETNIIDKFSFSSDANATDVGDLSLARYASSGQSSTAHGYTSGGVPLPSGGTTIDKFPFSSDANATDVGDMLHCGWTMAGQQV